MSLEEQVCTLCVMDTSDPNITFDENGVCNHWKEATEKLEKGWLPNENGQKLLEESAAEIRQAGTGKEYDCIIGVSGGIDSSYLLHVAVKLMKLRPLVVHVDAGWNSEIAVQNIEKLVKKLDLDLFTYVVNWEEMKDLQLAFLKSSVANQDIPQDHSFFAKLYEFAESKKIRYVITGSNLTSESILPSSWGYDASDSIHIKDIHKKFGKKKLKTYPMMGFIKSKIYWNYINKMNVISPLNWIDYNKNEAIEFLMKEYGWKFYGGKHHESKWTKFFQAYYLPKKFGFDKRKAHLSSMIVAGQITREEALEELKKPLYKEEELADDMNFISEKLGISLDEFKKLIELPNKDYSAYKNYQSRMQFLKKLKAKFFGKK